MLTIRANRTGAHTILMIAFAVAMPSTAGSVFATEISRPEPPPLPEATSVAAVSSHADEEPLHLQIDELIDATIKESQRAAASTASDPEFVRRVYLDLIGRVPDVNETRQFLAQTAQQDDSRTKLIDRLLASPEHVRRMQYVLDELIMERRGGSNVPDKDWRAWLRQAIAENRSWAWIAEQVLAADGAEDATRAPSKFYLDRNFASEVVTRDVGRVFLGVDLECAQCHDHPNIDSYLQRHYYGINAFLSRSYLFTDAKSKKKMLGEKAEGEVKFTSVFTDEEGGTAPRLLDLPPVADPEGMTGEYVSKPDKKTRGVPKYSRRGQLARQMIAPQNLDFRRNIANRIWALMTGRGLVEPLDVAHTDNPALHPALLDLLARGLLNHDDDLRWLMREIALSNTYQRSSQPVHSETEPTTLAVKASTDAPSSDEAGAETTPEADEFLTARIKPLSPEQLAWSVMQVLGVTERTLAAKQAELKQKDDKNKGADVDDPAWQEQVLREALKSNIDQFVAQFAGQGGQKTGFDATANQALFLINGPLVQGWLEPTGGSLTERLVKIEDNSMLADDLYMSVLGRQPEQTEVAEVSDVLNTSGDRTLAVKDLTWALLASAEFRFNH